MQNTENNTHGTHDTHDTHSTAQKKYDCVVIGGGAAGLFCAIQAGKNGQSVAVIEHTVKLAEKIRISGGGRCNFTNMDITPKAFISQNPHFMKSALKQFNQWDFIDYLVRHNIPYSEKTLGQLFCDNSATDIIDMLLDLCKQNAVDIFTDTTIESVQTHSKKEDHIHNTGFDIKTTKGDFTCGSCVVATGGLSIPKLGASNFGYKLAQHFGHTVIPTQPALVPLIFDSVFLEKYKTLSGVSMDAKITANGITFQEGFLFTHRGISGPSVLQISSYINAGESITITVCPKIDVYKALAEAKIKSPKKHIATVLKGFIPERFAAVVLQDYTQTKDVQTKDIQHKNTSHKSTSHKNAENRTDTSEYITENTAYTKPISGAKIPNTMMAAIPNTILQSIADDLQKWQITPTSTEGYRTAEVTRGGVNVDEVSSKTMESHLVKNLYFIGEVVDVTGWLGGYNFQWAWSSGYVAGINIGQNAGEKAEKKTEKKAAKETAKEKDTKI